jgi:large subunit ribosomal protein L10
MNREQKAAVIDELAAEIKSADAVFAVDYRGISVPEAADLRGRLREAETVFRIVKNSLTERASDAAGTEALKPMLEGPTALAFVRGDAALAAKALNDAARAFGALEFKGGLLSGAPLTAEEVQRIARLPARDVLHAQLVGTIAAPLSGLVRTLNALIAGLAVQLGQIAEQGLVSGEAPSEAEAPSASEAARASEAEGDASASGASASDADVAPAEPEAATDESQPEPDATAEPEGQAEDAPSEPEPAAESEPEAQASPAEAEAEDASASEALAPEAGAEQGDSEAHRAEEADVSADERETEDSGEQKSEPKEEA